MRLSEFIIRLEQYYDALENGIFKKLPDNPQCIRNNIDRCKKYHEENGDVLMDKNIMAEILKIRIK